MKLFLPNKSKWFARWVAVVFLALPPAWLQAQTYIEYNAPINISNGTVDEYNYILIGPDAALTIEEDWYVMAQNIYIHPDAVIMGPGVIHIMDPGTFGNLPSGSTTIDGGGVNIDAVISIENPNNVSLASIDPVAAIPAISWTDPGSTGSDNLLVGNQLNFGMAGGDVLLNDYHVIFDTLGIYTYNDLNDVAFPGGDLVPPATPDGALLVTNGTGYVGKLNLAGTFKFPVGIAEGDYTPATIASPATTSDFYVSVKNYAGSAAVEAAPGEGIDRTWEIYSSNNTSATITLQHNSATNGAVFNDAAAFVTQYQSNNSWGSAATNVDYGGAGDIPGSVIHSHTYTIPNAAGNSAFFSKSSDPVSPLPVTWLKFETKVTASCTIQLSWSTGSEQNTDYFVAERSTDGRTWTEVGRVEAAGNSSEIRNYSLADLQPDPGILQYRIRQADKDGTINYSVIRTVSTSCNAGTVKVYPTLNKTGIVYVNMPAGYENAQLRLISINGQLINTRMANNGLSRTIYLASLPSGEYVVQVINKGKIQSFKVSYAR